MPVGLRNSDVFMQMINNLTAKRRLDYTESGLMTKDIRLLSMVEK